LVQHQRPGAETPGRIRFIFNEAHRTEIDALYGEYKKMAEAEYMELTLRTLWFCVTGAILSGGMGRSSAGGVGRTITTPSTRRATAARRKP